MSEQGTVMEGVRAYGDDHPVLLNKYGPEGGRDVVCATNEGGFNCTLVDLADLLKWVAEHRQDMMVEAMLRADKPVALDTTCGQTLIVHPTAE